MNRGLASLAQKWNLTEPEFSYASRSFTLDFLVTDFITENMVRHSLYTAPDCQEGGTSLDDAAAFESKDSTFASSTESAPLANKEGDFQDRTSTITLTFDPETISDSEIYTEQTIDNQVIAEVRFCLRTALWTPDASIEVNFLETLITLTVDLTDGFTIGSVSVAPKDKLIRTANQAYEVIGFECQAVAGDPNAKWVTLADQQRTRNQGEIITVCVEPEEEAKLDGIKMRSIDDFTFSRADDPSIFQEAVKDGAQSGNLLTSYDANACRGSEQCRFTTILFAQFYSAAGQVAGAGVASMQFGSATNAPGATRRQLRTGARETQEDPEAGSAEFNLQFGVNQAAPSTSGAMRSIGSISLSVATIIGAAVAWM